MGLFASIASLKCFFRWSAASPVGRPSSLPLASWSDPTAGHGQTKKWGSFFHAKIEHLIGLFKLFFHPMGSGFINGEDGWTWNTSSRHFNCTDKRLYFVKEKQAGCSRQTTCSVAFPRLSILHLMSDMSGMYLVMTFQSHNTSIRRLSAWLAWVCAGTRDETGAPVVGNLCGFRRTHHELLGLPWLPAGKWQNRRVSWFDKALGCWIGGYIVSLFGGSMKVPQLINHGCHRGPGSTMWLSRSTKPRECPCS